MILPVDKPAGWTSFDVVAKLRSGLRWRKVGHAGTLDPMATGLLIVLFGECTSSSDEFMDLGKQYRGVVKLGVTTSTDDLDGDITSERPVNWDEVLVRNIVSSFRGEILQRPPAISAIKVNGERSYKIARSGKELSLEPRPVKIHEITVVELSCPFVTIEVTCGKGTYIRSIARDIGELLGCGGSLAKLRRTSIGDYQVEDAWRIEDALRVPEFRGQR